MFDLICGDSLDVLPTLPEASVDSIVTDPPYGLSFGGGWDWDKDAPGTQLWREALRVLKPGGYMLAFAGARTYHRMATNIEDAGFEIRDMLTWIYADGLTKSNDVGRSIDRMKHQLDQIYTVTGWIREARRAAGVSLKQIDDAFGFNGQARHWTSGGSQPSIPALEYVPKLLELLGMGPDDIPPDVHELLIDLNAAKGKPGANYTKRQVVGEVTQKKKGALSLDSQGLEKAIERVVPVTTAYSPEAQKWEGWGTQLKPAHEPIVAARRPTALEAGKPMSVARSCMVHGTGALNIGGCRLDSGNLPANVMHDGSPEVLREIPGAASFFYCPKPTRTERNAGVRGGRNTHPTVKPEALMAYLCRLVTPPGGTVLDPFSGSGSTGKGAVTSGFRYIGIELSEEFVDISRQRIAATQPGFAI